MWRRRVVLATYVGYPLAVAIFWIAEAENLGVWFRILGLIAGTIHAIGFFALCTRGFLGWRIANDPDSALDEREQHICDRAYRPSYWAVATILLAAVVYIQLAAQYDWWMPNSGGAFVAMNWIAVFVITTLPTAVIAWTEPDEATEE
jgi:hypothetical protein